MTQYRKERENRTRKHRRLSTDVDTIDAQWTAYYRHLFRICADHLSPSDDLAQFAVTVAEPEELHGLAARILDQQAELKVSTDSVAVLESVTQGSLSHLRSVFLRIIRQHDTLHTTIIDHIGDGAQVALTCPSVPDIVDQIVRIFSLSTTHARILMALYALEDIESVTNFMRAATHRTQMNLLAEAADTDLATLINETAPGARLERIGLIGYRGGRDEIADINISRPLLFALRSSTLDDLKAGLFDDTPSPRFKLSEFSISEGEMRTCAAAVRGGYPLLIAGDSGIGKTEFARD